MKQKISVRALIKREGRVLLLRRSGGRENLRGLYELPGGPILFGEAPELTLRRELNLEVGLGSEVAQLFDVISERDAENPKVQHIAIVYASSLHPGNITLGSEHDKYIWKEMSNIQLDTITSMTALILGITQFSGEVQVQSYSEGDTDDKNAVTHRCIIYTDGGSRGNPGPSASGYIIMNEREEVLFEGGKYLGVTTNNQAEYKAVLFGIKKAYELGARDIEIRMDSLLVANQMKGIYKIKNIDLIPIHNQIKLVAAKCERVHFIHVRREFNKLADGMVNKILDAEATSVLPTLL